MTGTAIITTTIHYPEETFKTLSAAGQLIVAGDVKTPYETRELVRGLGGTYLTVADQERWECSDVIGWNSIQRRNTAFLEAARQGFDTVITVDDDNCPEDALSWLMKHEKVLATAPMRVYTNNSGWFNPGSMLYPEVIARGMPYSLADPREMNNRSVRSVDNDTPPTVGVSAGLWLGDPDIDAMQRIVRAPYVERLGVNIPIPVQPGTFAPINSQNTAWRRELLPLACVFPGVGRWDDIFGGYAAQWSFWASNHVVSFGEPVVTQERNDHDLFVDLRKEVDGYAHTVQWIELLRGLEATGNPLVDLKVLAQTLRHTGDMYWHRTCSFIQAWVNDWERVR